jgi:predicted acyltransferase
MFIQGNLTSFDVMKIQPYSNTLQAIASGYVFAALVFLIPSRIMRFTVPFVLAAVYTALLAAFGDMSPAGNFAQIVEQAFVRALGFPEGALAYETYSYTWALTTLMFGAMAVWGSCCTEIVRLELSPWRRACILFGFAALLYVAGAVAQIWIPPVKQIFALSFTLRSMGVCVLALAVLYVVTDIWRLRRGWWLVTLFGQTALTCYVAKIGFGGVLNSFCRRLLVPGVRDALEPAAFKVVFILFTSAALTLVLVARRRLARAK